MIKCSCDLCGKEFKDDTSLFLIKEPYQSPAIKHLCGGCRTLLDTLIYKVDEALSGIKSRFFKEVLKRRRSAAKG